MQSVSKIIITIEPFVLPALVGAVSLTVGIILIVLTVRLIAMQVKLYNSISLVRLKSTKIHYVVFMLVLGFFMFYVITQMADAESPEAALMARLLNMKRWQTNMTLGFLLGLTVCVQFYFAVLLRSHSAVVDRGVYCGQKYWDWYHVYDYIIDERRGLVVLSGHKNTFATTARTTPPLRVGKNDVSKLKFILNKNKNKFSSIDDDRF